MNPIDLPFDADEMLAGLKPWIECESPTYDAAAVDRMMGKTPLSPRGRHLLRPRHSGYEGGQLRRG